MAAMLYKVKNVDIEFAPLVPEEVASSDIIRVYNSVARKVNEEAQVLADFIKSSEETSKLLGYVYAVLRSCKESEHEDVCREVVTSLYSLLHVYFRQRCGIKPLLIYSLQDELVIEVGEELPAAGEESQKLVVRAAVVVSFSK